MGHENYYRPTEHGHEAEVGRRLKHWARLRAQRAQRGHPDSRRARISRATAPRPDPFNSCVDAVSLW
ncbi:hypothetical protein ABTY96_29565 [Streptomyces sp. NPDC096057]|uniref:hypothetical protein n=1 Tax=Streptomyces sp. NPDC096057 TaxID=3155543 RepID=UPI00331BC516